MRNALALVEPPQPLAHPGYETNALLNLIPRRIVGKLLNGLNGDLLSRHTPILPFRGRAVSHGEYIPLEMGSG